MSIKTVSLFSGAGGLDIGFHQAGFDVVACVELEPLYCQTLAANKTKFLGRKAEINCIDVNKFNPKRYANLGIECVIGGPPCQTFSAAGRRSGGVLGTVDKRGRLFEAYCSILKTIKPRVFLFENVYGLPGANSGGPWREICEAFGSLGYRLRAEVLDSADYGVPQNRERLIIVGSQGSAEFRFPTPTHGPDSPSGIALVTVKDAIADLQEKSEPYHELDGLYGHLLSLVPEGLNYSFFTREMGYPKPYFAWRSKFHDFLYKVNPNAPARTIKAQPGKFTGPFHWKNRHFTIPELKRLQTFPDDYQICGSFIRVMEQIGNSVPPRLAHVLATSVKEQILRPQTRLTYEVRPVGFKSTFRLRQRERTLHFKKIAKDVIAERFPRVVTMPLRPKKEVQNFAVVFDGRFTREIVSKPRLELGRSCYSVALKRDGTKLHLRVRSAERIPRSNGRSFNVVISGLSKYLLDTDQLDCEAQLKTTDDAFHLWGILEECLTKNSQFFTLIDIYGHYANRGDTVKISTEIKCQRKSVLERAVEYFGNSDNCGAFQALGEVADALRVNRDEVTPLIARLRSMRWDVRTSETHSTIREAGILCTYPFPLLSAKAQLERKMNA